MSYKVTFENYASKAVKEGLDACGFKIRQWLPELGLAYGDITPDKVKTVRNIKGVKAVSPEGNVEGFGVAPTSGT